MTSDFEFEGKTVEQAVEEACRKLSLKKSDMKYDVLSYGSTGIFGLVGMKKARIRIKPAENHRLEKAENAKPPAEEAQEATALHSDAIEEPPVMAIPTDEIVERCRGSLQRIVDAITTDATISVDSSSDGIRFHISGGNAAVLIGKRGQTLEAIQHLIEKIGNKQNGDTLRIQVDVEGYLKNRKENLEKLAARMAQKALQTGKTMTLGQMNPHDRRIVHLALKSDTSVKTQSIGEGLYRKLTISPKKRGRGRKPTENSG